MFEFLSDFGFVVSIFFFLLNSSDILINKMMKKNLILLQYVCEVLDLEISLSKYFGNIMLHTCSVHCIQSEWISRLQCISVLTWHLFHSYSGHTQNSATICISPSTCPGSEILNKSFKKNQKQPKILEQQKILLWDNIKIRKYL